MYHVAFIVPTTETAPVAEELVFEFQAPKGADVFSD